MFVRFLAGILLALTIWYVLWTRERFFMGLEKILDIIVEEYRLEYPDEDIRNLRINVRFKDEQIELEEEEK